MRGTKPPVSGEDLSSHSSQLLELHWTFGEDIDQCRLEGSVDIRGTLHSNRRGVRAVHGCPGTCRERPCVSWAIKQTSTERK